MRGYFDGDGSFYYSLAKNKKSRQKYINIRGTQEFLTMYRSILERECDIDKKEKDIRLNSGIGALEYGGNNIVEKISDFLYKDATVWMKRKKSV